MFLRSGNNYFEMVNNLIPGTNKTVQALVQISPEDIYTRTSGRITPQNIQSQVQDLNTFYQNQPLQPNQEASTAFGVPLYSFGSGNYGGSFQISPEVAKLIGQSGGTPGVQTTSNELQRAGLDSQGYTIGQPRTLAGGPSSSVGIQTGGQGGNVGNAGGVNNGLPSTGNPQYDAVIGQLNDFLNKLKANGQSINPNIEITPDKLKEFETLASGQIHPYFASQLKVATDTFLKSLGYSADTLALQEKDAQIKYAETLKNLGESAAEKGFAQSGQRVLGEQNLARDTQATLDQNRRELQFNAGNAAGRFAQEYGIPNFTAPTLTGAPRVLAGQSSFDISNSPSNLYNLSPEVYNGLISNQQNQEKAATDTLSRTLATDYTTKLANAQTRALTL